MNDKAKYFIFGVGVIVVLQILLVPTFHMKVESSDRPFFKSWFSHEDSTIPFKRYDDNETRKRSSSGYGYDDDNS
jgi:hypothetical protein